METSEIFKQSFLKAKNLKMSEEELKASIKNQKLKILAKELQKFAEYFSYIEHHFLFQTKGYSDKYTLFRGSLFTFKEMANPKEVYFNKLFIELKCKFIAKVDDNLKFEYFIECDFEKAPLYFDDFLCFVDWFSNRVVKYAHDEVV